MYGNLLSTLVKVTTDRSDLMRIVIMSWNEDLVDVDHRTHDIWVVSFTTWSRRSPFYGRAQTCRNQSNVWNSRRQLHVIPKFETKIHRLEFAQVILISVAPTLQNLRIGLRTEWQERCAREAAWKSAKIILKFKEKDKQTFFSPSEKPEER